MSALLAVKLTNIAAFVITLLLAQKYGRLDGLNPVLMRTAAVFGMAGALCGGHLYAALTAPAMAVPPALWSPLSGDKGVLGAFFGAVLCAGTYLRCKRVCVRDYLESAVPAVALGYIVARLGCFINGDDFGMVSSVPWAWQFAPWTEAYAEHLRRGWIDAGSAASLPVHPTQLYHAGAALAWFCLVRAAGTTWRGRVLPLTLIYYGAGRLVIQFFRDDHWHQYAGLDAAQWVSLFMVAAGLLLCFHPTGRSGKPAPVGP